MSVAALGTITFIASACGNNDAEILSSRRDRVGATASTAAPGTGASTTTTTGPRATTTTAAPTSALPAGQQLAVNFTYAMTGIGAPKNPYIAVWVADANGKLVKTLSLWYEQGRGERYLNELRSWMSASGGVTPTTSGASRGVGTYTVVWDGTDESGQPVAPGTYQVFVEAAREHGPYEVTSAQFTADGKSFAVQLPDNGELTAVSAATVS